jgi:hypothetical protein
VVTPSFRKLFDVACKVIFFSKKGSLQQNIPFLENYVTSWQFLAKKQKSQTKLLKKMESIVICTLPL